MHRQFKTPSQHKAPSQHVIPCFYSLDRVERRSDEGLYYNTDTGIISYGLTPDGNYASLEVVIYSNQKTHVIPGEADEQYFYDPMTHEFHDHNGEGRFPIEAFDSEIAPDGYPKPSLNFYKAVVGKGNQNIRELPPTPLCLLEASQGTYFTINHGNGNIVPVFMTDMKLSLSHINTLYPHLEDPCDEDSIRFIKKAVINNDGTVNHFRVPEQCTVKFNYFDCMSFFDLGAEGQEPTTSSPAAATKANIIFQSYYLDKLNANVERHLGKNTLSGESEIATPAVPAAPIAPEVITPEVFTPVTNTANTVADPVTVSNTEDVEGEDDIVLVDTTGINTETTNTETTNTETTDTISEEVSAEAENNSVTQESVSETQAVPA